MANAREHMTDTTHHPSSIRDWQKEIERGQERAEHQCDKVLKPGYKLSFGHSWLHFEKADTKVGPLLPLEEYKYRLKASS